MVDAGPEPTYEEKNKITPRLVAKVYCSRVIYIALFFVQFSALHYFIFSFYTNWNFNRMFSSVFQIFLLIFDKKYYYLTFLQQFFNTCYLFLKKCSQRL